MKEGILAFLKLALVFCGILTALGLIVAWFFLVTWLVGKVIEWLDEHTKWWF